MMAEAADQPDNIRHFFKGSLDLVAAKKCEICGYGGLTAFIEI